MQVAYEISSELKLNGKIPAAFESEILNYRGSRRYVATMWSEYFQSLICTDGKIWQTNEVDEDEWVWWTYTLTLLNDFNYSSLGFDVDLPIHVLLLDLRDREVWLVPISQAFDVLVKQSNPM